MLCPCFLTLTRTRTLALNLNLTLTITLTLNLTLTLTLTLTLARAHVGDALDVVGHLVVGEGGVLYLEEVGHAEGAGGRPAQG